MITFRKARLSPREQRLQDNANAQLALQQAQIEYLAIMTEVEFPTNEDETVTENIKEVEE